MDLSLSSTLLKNTLFYVNLFVTIVLKLTQDKRLPSSLKDRYSNDDSGTMQAKPQFAAHATFTHN